MPRRSRMDHHSHAHFALPHQRSILAERFQGFAGKIVMFEQGQRQVFRQPRIGGHGNQDLRRSIMDQTLQVGIGGKTYFLVFTTDARRFR